jgi:hypothetical protein
VGQYPVSSKIDMSMKKNNICIALLMLLLFCCRSKNSENVASGTGAPTVINIVDSLHNEVDRLLLSDAAVDIDIVRLEVNEDHLFNRIDYVTVSGSDIFIGSLGKEVMRYSKDGKFVNTIGSRGQGVGEFLFNLGIKPDSTNLIIRIISSFDNTDFKILNYTFDGTFLGSSEIASSTFRNFYNLHQKNAMYDTGEYIFILPQLNNLSGNQETDCFSFLQYNTVTGEFRAFYNPVNFGHEKDYAEHYVGSHSNDVYWCEFPAQIVSYGGHESVLLEHNDTIYCFNSAMDSLQVRFTMNCGERPDFGIAHAFAKDISFFKYIYVSKMLESKDFMHLAVSKSSDQYLLQFDKRNGHIRTIREKRPIETSSFNVLYRKGEFAPPGFTNDLCGGLPFYPEHVDKHHWIAKYEAFDLLEKIDIEKLRNADVLIPEKRDKLVDILEHLDEDDNPVLMITTLKQ